MLLEYQVQAWLAELPKFGCSLNADALVLASYIQTGEHFLSKLPIKLERDLQAQKIAEQIFQSSRQARILFLDRYASEVYAAITHQFEQYQNLSELVFNAAELFPGLVPTRAQLEVEKNSLQAHKEGLEIDQGVFFRALLRAPLVANHLMDAMLKPSQKAVNLLPLLQQTGIVDLDSVLLECKGEVAYLTINNQHCLNAEDNQLIDDLETAIDLTLLNEKIKLGVVRGGIMTHSRYVGKRVFCSGINLFDLHAGKISFVNFLLKRELGYISKIMHGLLVDVSRMHTIQKPWIAVVDSFAIGGGMQLLLAFDKVIAAEDSYFSLPAAQEGIVPGVANLRLLRFTGSKLARQIILSGRKILATDPEAKYICDEVVRRNEIDKAIEDSVQAFNNPAVVENRRMFSIVEEPRSHFSHYLSEFAYVQATRLYSPDVLEKIGRWAKKHC